MDQFSSKCPIVNHNSSAIKYVCVLPQCEGSRYLCSICVSGHKHNAFDSSSILTITEFNNILKSNFSKFSEKNIDFFEQSIGSLKLIILETQNLLKNINSIIFYLEQGIQQQSNKIKSYILRRDSHIDYQLFNNLINYFFRDQDAYQQLKEQSNQVMQNALKIKQWSQSIIVNYEQSDLQQIKDAKYEIKQIDHFLYQQIQTAAISNNLKYIISVSEDKSLKIWNYKNNNLIKSIKLNDDICSIKFTKDSKILYIGCKQLYQFYVDNQFKNLWKQQKHYTQIRNIYCITNTILLTSCQKGTIIQTDIKIKQQIFKIQAHNDWIQGLDYNKNRNIIASGSFDSAIKLWNGIDGKLILKNKNAHKNYQLIHQVLFILNNDQLISKDETNQLRIWNINYETKQLEIYELIQVGTLCISLALNISLALDQQYIIVICSKVIKIYTIKGDYVRQLDHAMECDRHFNIGQLDSMKAVLILGKCKSQQYNIWQDQINICKLDLE